MENTIWRHKNIHMVGIKGAGMAGLAEVLLANGFVISGSDVKEKFFTDVTLARLGIPVSEFNSKNLAGADAVVRSNAYNGANPEVAAAQELGIPVFSYPEVAAMLFNAHYGVAVAGSHGKTTTTAMLGHILKYCEKNVTAIVGSRVANWQSGAAAGALTKPDALFVLEADEYKDAFLNYRPKGAIITNVDFDHPDYFLNRDDYRNAFEKFAALISDDGFLIVNADDPRSLEVAERARCRVIKLHGNFVPDVRLQVFGKHNALNAAMAYRAALELGASAPDATRALKSFKGTARRLELIGKKNGAFIIDDFAHHPAEIRATLSALFERYPKKKIIAVFQPHTYSRTRALFDEFASSFSNADLVILTDVYASGREQKDEGLRMAEMVAAVRAKGKEAALIEDKTEIPEYLAPRLNSDTVIVTLGAGDIWKVTRELI